MNIPAPHAIPDENVLIGRRLKDRRTYLRLTQQEVAEAIHISRSNYTKYEAGAVDLNVSTLRELAKVLNCTITYLIGEYDVDVAEDSVEAQMRNLPPPMQSSIRAMIRTANEEMLKEETTHGRKAE